MREPNDSDLALAWLSYLELHKNGMVLLNPCPESYKALRMYDGRKFKEVMGKVSIFTTNVHKYVLHNPRAFLTAYNSGMDFMAKEGGCVMLTQRISQQILQNLEVASKKRYFLRVQ
jgi:hypothetical protein